MNNIRLYPYHKTQFDNGMDINGGKVHFNDDAKITHIDVLTATELESSHHNQLTFTSLAAVAGISADGLDQALGVGRQIEVIGVDGGMHTKGIVGSSYTQHDTTHNSYLIRIRLTTMYSTDTWTQANPWRVTLNILSGDGITGNFTVFMPPFTLLSYSTLELYVTTDGTTYNTKTTKGFDRSLAGSSAATEVMVNDEGAGSDVVIEVASTTGFYVGNEVFISDSENSEWTRIKSLISNTSITVTELTNSYTTANGAKLDIIDYIQTIPTIPVQRGMSKTKVFNAGIKSGLSVHYPIPFESDPTEDITLMLRYTTTEDNPLAKAVKWCIQYSVYPVGEDIPESIQYGEISTCLTTPLATKQQQQQVIGTIPATYINGENAGVLQLVRMGGSVEDTFTGDVRLIALLVITKQDRLGYEV